MDRGQEYTKLTVRAYEEKYGPAKEADTPVSFDLRKEDPGPDARPPKDLRALQGILGMLLWLSRCARCDITFAVAVLSSRVHRWTDACGTQLGRLSGYLKKTIGTRLHLRVHKQDDAMDLELVSLR